MGPSINDVMPEERRVFRSTRPIMMKEAQKGMTRRGGG